MNTDTNVYGEKIFLLLNGIQYDLNTEDDHNDTSFKIMFPELAEGDHYASLLCENQYIEAPEFLSPETEIRFLIRNKNRSL